jgi:hypothetical protein
MAKKTATIPAFRIEEELADKFDVALADFRSDKATFLRACIELRRNRSGHVCVPGYAKKVRAVPAWLKRQAYAEYGITEYKTGDYEVDHLIPLSLGGSNSIRNLWPQSTKTSTWNSFVKDVLG